MQLVIPFRRRRDLGDVLNVTFQFIRQNIGTLGKSLVFIVAPAWVVLAVANVFLQTSLLDFDPVEGGEGYDAVIGLEYLVVIVFAVLCFVLEVAAVYGFMVLYQDRGGAEGIVVDDVWSVTKAHFWRVLGASVLLGLVFIVSAAVVVLPCLGALAYLAGVVYAGVLFAVTLPMLVRERIGIVDAFQRARYLARGHWWETFAVVFVAWFVCAILGFLFNMPAMVISFVYGLHEGEGGGGGGGLRALLALASVVGSMGSVLLYPIPLIASGFQYFSLIEEKEKVGLMERIDAIDTGGEDDFWRREGGDRPANP